LLRRSSVTAGKILTYRADIEKKAAYEDIGAKRGNSEMNTSIVTVIVVIIALGTIDGLSPLPAPPGFFSASSGARTEPA
jgi:hypothetical protein